MKDIFIGAIIFLVFFVFFIIAICMIVLKITDHKKDRKYTKIYIQSDNYPYKPHTPYPPHTPNNQYKGVYFYPDLSANRASNEYIAYKDKKSGMDLLLSVPYEEKNEAKKNGAWWNRDLKRWYVNENPRQPYFLNWNKYFRKWLPENNLLCRDLYIFKMYRQCRKCGQFTPVISLATKDAYTLFEGKDTYERYQSLQLLSYVDKIPNELAMYLKENFKYFPSSSFDNEKPYYINHCEHCGSVQEDLYLHEFPKEAFYRYLCHRDFEKSNFYKVKIKHLVSILADLPYYDYYAHSDALMLAHMETEIENRTSLNVTQSLINRLFEDSDFLGEIEINGI